MAQDQAYLFLVFSLTGIIIGTMFDVFRVLRRIFKTSNIITYIEDIIFWILTGFLILYNIWYFNNGEIRIFMFLGVILGVLIYMLTLSNIIIKIFTKILQTIIKFLNMPFKILKNISINIVNFYKKITNKRGNIKNNVE